MVKEPNYNDPWGPRPGGHRKCRCLHCGLEFREDEMLWIDTYEDGGGIWTCPNFHHCGGAGIGVDVFPEGDEVYDEIGEMFQ